MYFSQVFCINLNSWNVIHTDVTTFAQVFVLVLVLVLKSWSLRVKSWSWSLAPKSWSWSLVKSPC